MIKGVMELPKRWCFQKKFQKENDGLKLSFQNRRMAICMQFQRSKLAAKTAVFLFVSVMLLISPRLYWQIRVAPFARQGNLLLLQIILCED